MKKILAAMLLFPAMSVYAGEASKVIQDKAVKPSNPVTMETQIDPSLLDQMKEIIQREGMTTLPK